MICAAKKAVLLSIRGIAESAIPEQEPPFFIACHREGCWSLTGSNAASPIQSVIGGIMNQFSFPHGIIGPDAFHSLPEICRPYGETLALIGSRSGLAGAGRDIQNACLWKLYLTGTFVCPEKSTRSAAAALTSIKEIRSADMLFAIGGNEEMDLVKYAGMFLHKPVMAVPVLADGCSSSNSLCLMEENGTRKPIQCTKAAHVFLRTDLLVHTPPALLQQGLSRAIYALAEVLAETPNSFYGHLGASCAREILAHLMSTGLKATKEQDHGALAEFCTDITYFSGLPAEEISEPCLSHRLPLLPDGLLPWVSLYLLTLSGQLAVRDELLQFCDALSLPCRLSELPISKTILRSRLEGLAPQHTAPDAKTEWNQTVAELENAAQRIIPAK